jgi:Na+/melibiose symporter-like transporter
MLVIAAIIVQGQGGANADAVNAMGWSLIFALPLCVAAALVFVQEPEAPPQPHLSLAAQIKTVLANKTVRRVLAPDLLLGVVQGISGGLFLFYFEDVLRFETQSQTLLAIYFVAGLIGAPLWWIIGRKLGKHRALQIVFAYTAIATAALLFMPPGNFGVVAPFMFLGGMAQGGGVLLTRALMADVVDEDEAVSGARRSGLYFGLLLTTSKIGLALGPASLALLSVFGFDPQAGAHNSASALGALTALNIGAPILLCVLGYLSLRNYPLDEARQAALTALISARQAENNEKIAGPSTK